MKNRHLVISIAAAMVLSLVTVPANAATQDQINQAITTGLACLVSQQHAADGSWTGSGGYPPVAYTSFAVAKLEQRAFDLGYASPFDPAYPYNGNVTNGLNYIFSQAATYGAVSTDVCFAKYPGSGEGEETYCTGIAMMAIANSRAPGYIVNVPATPGSIVNGMTYAQVLQSCVDHFAWAQNPDGGWRYYASEEPSDNSNTGYAVMGLRYAEDPLYGFGCAIPLTLTNALSTTWIPKIQESAGLYDGGSDYTVGGGGANLLKTGDLLCEMLFVGDNMSMQRDQRAIAYIQNNWNDNNEDPGWMPTNYQAMFCLMEGLGGFNINNITVNETNVDWFAAFADAIVTSQYPDGHWEDVNEEGDATLCTEWALIVLEKQSPLSCITITCPTNIVVPAPCGTAAFREIPESYAATATDTCCSNQVTLTYNPVSGSLFSPGTTTVLVTATDSCNNTNYGSFTVTVLWPDCCPDTNGVKYVQNPDFTTSSNGVPNGLDMNATFAPPDPLNNQSWVLADDFPCTNCGPITDIHLWGSWLNDQVDTNAIYTLAIWSDVPANGAGQWSTPGQLLWSQTYGPGQYTLCLSTNQIETFADENFEGDLFLEEAYGLSSDLFYMSFDASPTNIFYQTGTPAAPTNYWLSLTVQSASTNLYFGWMSSATAYNDVAVAAWGSVYPSPSDWYPIYSQASSNFQGGPLNLAFKITTGTNACSLAINCANLVVYSCTNIPVYYTNTITDNCCSSVTVTYMPTNGSTFFPNTTKGVTCYATDCCGNTDSCSFTVTVLCTNCLPPPTNMVLWLPFDCTNGNVTANYSSPTNFGTYVGNPTTVLGLYVGNSIFFNGIDQYVTVPDYPAIEIGTNDFTIDAWVECPTNSGSNTRTIVEKRAGNDPYYGFVFDTYSNTLLLQLADGTWDNYYNTASVPTDGQWHLVAVTVQRAATNGLQFYVDGVPKGAPFNPTGHEGSLSNSAPLVVGALTDSGTYWLGGIDEVEMFSRALSPEEIQAIYSFGTAGKCKPCACTNNCISIVCPDSIVYWPTNNIPINYNLQFSDACCGTNWWSVYNPTNGHIFPPNTTNVVTCCVYDSCGNSNCCSFIVVCQGALPQPTPIVIKPSSNGFTLNAANYPFILLTNWDWNLQESTDLMSGWTTASTNTPPYYISNLLLPQQFFRLMINTN